MKSSYSNSQGNCVHVKKLRVYDPNTNDYETGFVVTDDKIPISPRLVFTRDEWAAFVNGVKDGEFDTDTMMTENDVIIPALPFIDVKAV